ncbi:MAG: hypothetical protein PUP92_27910 [Rhizonema sp. PD38]|nr:hypothetical protein [Rhizonema sp. PD38]
MYQKQIGLGLLGGAIIAIPLLYQLPGQFNSYTALAKLKARSEIARSQINISEQTERDRIIARGKTADTLQKTGVLPTATKLKIRRYLDNVKRDPKPDTAGWSDSVVYVYDAAGKCIGRIENRQWYWKHRYLDACTYN